MKKKIQTTEKNVQKLTMKQLPKEDRPYEKCLTQGARFLTDEELLAVIIRTGSKDATSLELARSILALEGHGTRLLGLLHHSLKDYCRIKGIVMVKEQEEIHVMFLNTKQNLLRDFLVSKGTVNASVITPREILIEGLRSLAVSMILVHNHPSGDPSPSESDLLLTRRVKEAGDVIGISLLDHIIIGDKRYLSFRQQQIM